MTAELRTRLSAVPVIELPLADEVERAIDATRAWLSSDAALRLLRADPYWPKWDGPWWRMRALHELGRAESIPRQAVDGMVEALRALPVHTFPIREEDWPDGVDRRRASLCHCAVGCIDQVLTACGVDVDQELPWIAAWFAHYQLSDGGYNCDPGAYLVTDECASSMVATVAVLEAMTRGRPSETCDRSAALLIERRLIEGSPTRHNAEEREAARSWGALCLPRFYFYDVLRGAAALARWAVEHRRDLPWAAVEPALEQLLSTAKDGVVRVGRVGWRGMTSWVPEDGWTARHPARPSELAACCGRVGDPSPTLTAQWAQLRRDLLELLDAGRLAP